MTPKLVYSLRPDKVNKRIAGLQQDTREVLKQLVAMDTGRRDEASLRAAVGASTGFPEEKLNRCFAELKTQELFIGNGFASNVARKQAENKLFQGNQLAALRAELGNDQQASGQ